MIFKTFASMLKAHRIFRATLLLLIISTNSEDIIFFKKQHKTLGRQGLDLGFLVLFFETGSHSVTQAGLKLATLLPQPPKCWDYRCEPPHLAKNKLSTSTFYAVGKNRTHRTAKHA
jgi:hypothetical protein